MTSTINNTVVTYFSSMLRLPMRIQASGDAKSSEEIVAELAAEMHDKMPPTISLEDAADGLFDRNAAGQMKSLSIVLVQEVERFNRLIKAMKSSLHHLGRAIGGLVVMSSDLEKMFNSLLNNQVPA